MLTKHYSHNENETWNDFINQPIWFNIVELSMIIIFL